MKRGIVYFVGLNLIAFAVVFNIRLNFGVAAFSSSMYATSEIFGISLGTASIIFYLLFIVIQCVLSRKISLMYILEIPLSFAFGWLTDLYDFILPEIPFVFPVRLVLFCLSMCVTSMGVFLCVRSNLVLTPTDGIVKTISEVFGLPFSACKNGFDITMVLLTVILCAVNHTQFYGIGIGTVLSAVCLGRIIRIYEKKIPLSFPPLSWQKSK